MNLPGFWDTHWLLCWECGREFHASWGGCDECATAQAEQEADDEDDELTEAQDVARAE